MATVCLAVLAGCSSDDNGDDDVQLGEIAEFEDAPPCPQAGDTLTDEHLDGCVDDTDGITILGTFTCEDGSTLWGGDDLWARVGEVVVQTDGPVSGDPGYKAAYDDCQGT